MSFDALLDDLDTVLRDEEQLLAKAQSPAEDDEDDDAAIAAAAEDDGDDADDADDDDGEDLVKSFRVMLDDGSEADAVDGEALIKSFHGEIETLRSDMHGALSQVAEAITRSTRLIKSLREQNADLATQLKELGSQGRGRKSSLSVHERTMVGDESMRGAEKPQPAMVMAKALAAQSAGRLSGTEVAELDAYLARGLSVPETLLAKIGA